MRSGKIFCQNVISKRELLYVKNNIYYRNKTFLKPFEVPILSVIAISKLQSTWASADKQIQFDILDSKSLQNVPATKIYLRALGSGVSGVSRSLYVFTDKERFLFGFGDASLRLCYEFDTKPFSKINPLFGIFLTSINCGNVSGILDLREYLSFLGSPACNIYCPQGLSDIISRSSFLTPEFKLSKCSFKINELIEEGKIESSLSIKYIPIYSSIPNLNSRYSTNCPRDYVLAYVCQSKSNIVRTLIQNKLLEYKVPSHEKQFVCSLKNGEPVTLSNGKVVKSEDVCLLQGHSGKTFIILDIPSTTYLDYLMSTNAFVQYQQTESLSSENIPEVIVHFSPYEVLIDKKFTEWINRFPPSVSHLVLNDKCVGEDLIKSTMLQKNLNFYFPQVFPLPFVLSEKELKADIPSYAFEGPTVQALSGMQYHLRPNTKFDYSDCSDISSSYADSYKKNILSTYEQTMKTIPYMEDTINNHCKEYPHIYFLGTGSTRSMAYRNCSSILLNINNSTSILLDCGAGTLNQIIRLFGFEKTSKILKNLKLIYVSHHHLDHFLGIPTLLAERAKIKDVPKLYIFGITKVLKFLHSLSPNLLHLDNSTVLAHNMELMHFSKHFSPLLHEQVCDYLNMAKIETCFVPHCHDSFGAAFSHDKGWKLVYSGDTKPSERLVDIGKDCDLLIHEATLEDGLEDIALNRSHSTISQAIDVGRCMKAKHVILTHFSQRYCTIPLLKDDIPDNVGIAFDYMKVTLADLPFLSHFYPIYKEMFIGKWKGMSKRKEKRELRVKNLSGKSLVQTKALFS